MYTRIMVIMRLKVKWLLRLLKGKVTNLIVQKIQFLSGSQQILSLSLIIIMEKISTFRNLNKPGIHKHF